MLSQENKNLKGKLKNTKNINISSEQNKNSFNLDNLAISKSYLKKEENESDKMTFTLFNNDSQNKITTKKTVFYNKQIQEIYLHLLALQTMGKI